MTDKKQKAKTDMSKVDRYYTLRLRRAFNRGDMMAIYRLQHAWQQDSANKAKP